jgi:hypothetical protein
MTTNAIFSPGQQSQNDGMRDDLQRVRPDLRLAPTRTVGRAVPDVESIGG